MPDKKNQSPQKSGGDKGAGQPRDPSNPKPVTPITDIPNTKRK
jgi:hypothetical protein